MGELVQEIHICKNHDFVDMLLTDGVIFICINIAPPRIFAVMRGSALLPNNTPETRHQCMQTDNICIQRYCRYSEKQELQTNRSLRTPRVSEDLAAAA